MAYINGNEVLFSAQIHDGYNRGFADGQSSMIDESKIIEKTASGAYISVDDVSEIPHKVACTVGGANLLNPNGFSGGEFVEYNEVQCYKYVDNATNFTYNGVFKENTQYTFSFKIYAEKRVVDLRIRYTDGTAEPIYGVSGVAQTVVTAPNKTIARITGAHNANANLYIDLSYTRLNKGTTALPYAPYVAPETVQVTRMGANLCPVKDAEYIQNKRVVFDTPLPVGTYTFSGIVTSEQADYYLLVRCMSGFDDLTLAADSFAFKQATETRQSKTVYIRKPCTHFYIYTADGAVHGTGIKGKFADFQVNRGTTALPYEPYNGQTLTPATDGTVEGMTSVSPYMNVFTDNAGAALDIAYRMSWGMQEERERFYNDFQQGKINVSISFEWLALDKANTTSIINALSDTVTGQTLTLNLAAVNTAFETSSGAKDGSTSTEFAALVATKTNWTIVLK